MQPGQQRGQPGFEASEGAQMDGASCSTEQYRRLVGLVLLGMKLIILYKIY